jgi:hypothetical protein
MLFPYNVTAEGVTTVRSKSFSSSLAEITLLAGSIHTRVALKGRVRSVIVTVYILRALGGMDPSTIYRPSEVSISVNGRIFLREMRPNPYTPTRPRRESAYESKS